MGRIANCMAVLLRVHGAYAVCNGIYDIRRKRKGPVRRVKGESSKIDIVGIVFTTENIATSCKRC